jgi:hypothetical protein
VQKLVAAAPFLHFDSRKGTFELADRIEMRMTSEGYEVVLLTREQLYANYSTRGVGLVLFKLPYKALWALQGGIFHAHKKATEALEAADFTYHSDAEVSSAWDFQNKDGSFRWWGV